MDASRWQRVKDTVHAALARPAAERAAFIDRSCGGDAALRAEIESLLTAIERAGSFIERPAFERLDNAERGRLEPGSSFGAYTILESVGVGGMGEVYKARDANLNRDVALKIRRTVAPLDADRVARVKREAQIVAALNHPNIAAIYGLEQSDGVHALVLELVEGSTLQARIDGGRILLSDALSIAKQIANGLEAAHARGIIHRDLKPANIKLRADGTVKILDFGLAKMHDVVDGADVAADSVGTPSTAISHTGLVFGTAPYMSPEQARGEEVDERTDIWAFGCVLYEMLTGKPAFAADTIEETLSAVLDREPDWRALPAGTPAGILRVLSRCLEKNPSRRLHDIADARIEIEDASAATPPSVPQKRRWPAVAGGVGVVMVASVLAIAAWGWPASRARDVTVKRLQLRLPETGPLAQASSMPLGLGQLSMAIAPDGARLAYVLEHQGVMRLYLHALDQPEPRAIPATEGAFGPFFSPDGRWIGFFADNKLKKVAVSGGEPIVLSEAANPYGGSWGADGIILFAPNEGQRPTRIHENGGPPQPIEVRNFNGSYRRPDLLPGGKAAIVSNPLHGVGVLSFNTSEFRLLVPGAGGGRYAAGHLLFARSGMLLSVPFDPERLEIVGPEALVVEGVRTDVEGVTFHPQAVLSREGTLVYASGRGSANETRPVWVDRRGNVQPLGMPPRAYRNMRLSPDGRFLAIVVADPKNDLWVQDLERGTLTRRTSGAEPGVVHWSLDGERIMFGSRRDGRRQAFWVPRDGSREPQPLNTAEGDPPLGSLSPDGRLVAGFTRDPKTGMDLWVRPVKESEPVQPFLRTRFNELGPVFSPDGRWIAYVSDESGQYEVYVRPYPARQGQWQVSMGGGEEPIWSRDGSELFYRNGRRWMTAALKLTPFTPEKPKLLFEGPYVNVGGRSYDVTADGQRFLVLEPAAEITPVTYLNVVLNWEEELKRRVGSATAPPTR